MDHVSAHHDCRVRWIGEVAYRRRVGNRVDPAKLNVDPTSEQISVDRHVSAMRQLTSSIRSRNIET